MIISVSIIDKHRPKGKRHIGTYTFEIDYPAGEHPKQFDFMVLDCPRENESAARRLVGRLMTADDLQREGGAVEVRL